MRASYTIGEKLLCARTTSPREDPMHIAPCEAHASVLYVVFRSSGMNISA